MVLGILTAIAAAPAIVGTTEAVRQGQKNNSRESHRGRKTNLSVTLLRRSSTRHAALNDVLVVLKDNKLYVDARPEVPKDEKYHPVTGYFLPWPHGNLAEEWRQLGFARGEGYVTTINDENFLNWVYVDSTTHEVKYGVRVEAEQHKVGPWDCTKVEKRLTFDGWEGFMAVDEEEGSGLWGLYFDCDDDGLRGEGQPGKEGKMIVQLEVWRKEIRRERVDAVTERFDRLGMREEQRKVSKEEPNGVVEETTSTGVGGFESRLQVQRDVAGAPYATDFETRLQQQREIGKNMFGKR
ncbi:hypothetical protein LTR10_010609 [Elasticomyces elasticus]|nr:hypothetical protein LTR10_010609 [Elasticomyces elasticus]KAK4968215.1 hypothetical protein LTR42_009498 [Elasticomyces elasticus]